MPEACLGRLCLGQAWSVVVRPVSARLRTGPNGTTPRVSPERLRLASLGDVGRGKAACGEARHVPVGRGLARQGKGVYGATRESVWQRSARQGRAGRGMS